MRSFHVLQKKRGAEENYYKFTGLTVSRKDMTKHILYMRKKNTERGRDRGFPNSKAPSNSVI